MSIKKNSTRDIRTPVPAVQPFRRILVLGCGGSGKSTLACGLGALTGLPVVHLDRLFWLPGWKHRSREEFDELLAAELAKEHWIIDGDYDRTLPLRLQRCDAVALLDYPGAVCAAGITKRRLQHRKTARPSMAEGCPERLDRDFLRWVLSYRRRVRPGHMEMLRQVSLREQPPQIFILKNRKQTREWLAAVGSAYSGTKDNRHPTSPQEIKS